MATYIKFDKIYDDIFSKSFNKSVYVFLCGGAREGNIRNRVRDNLNKRNFKILYPEDLFIDMLNRNKKANLVELEAFLVDNSDVICVICESIGSAAELGAFTQNDQIRSKMVAAVLKKFARRSSFVMMGPMRMLRATNKDCVLTYTTDKLDEFYDSLEKTINKIHKKNNIRMKSQNFDNLSSFIGFIPLILYYYKAVSKKVFFKELKNFLTSRVMINKDFENFFFASIKYLLKTRVIKVQNKSVDLQLIDECYELTTKGFWEVEVLLQNSQITNKTILHDGIRLDIMRQQMSRSS